MPVISDLWEGLDRLFVSGREIILAADPGEIEEFLASYPPAMAEAIGEAARSRVLEGHGAADRAAELERFLGEAAEAQSWPVLNTLSP